MSPYCSKQAMLPVWNVEDRASFLWHPFSLRETCCWCPISWRQLVLSLYPHNLMPYCTSHFQHFTIRVYLLLENNSPLVLNTNNEAVLMTVTNATNPSESYNKNTSNSERFRPIRRIQQL